MAFVIVLTTINQVTGINVDISRKCC